jgi:hypothetical protein
VLAQARIRLRADEADDQAQPLGEEHIVWRDI